MSVMKMIAASPEGAAEGRRGILNDLWGVLTLRQQEAVFRCAGRMHSALPRPGHLSDNVVLTGYGGGKDSSYMLSFVRATQLLLARAYSGTFSLRVVTNWQPGMPRAVMENIDRTYRRLGLYDDPDCEMLLVDGGRLRPFDVGAPVSPEAVERSRLDLLMTGHRMGGQGRPTFCNACNLSMLNSFGLAASYRGGVDLIITGDSLTELRAYHRWVARLARRLSDGETAAESAQAGASAGFGSFLASADRIARSYYNDIFAANQPLVEQRRVASSVSPQLRLFSVYEDTGYAAGDHWEVLTDFLGFVFDELAFSFTESDCANPGLMAHMRGLRCEHVYGRTYHEGLREYVDFATDLMRRKDFPDQLIEVMRKRYQGEDSVTRMRLLMNKYAQDAYGVTEEQLVCMVWSPFAGEASLLRDYLSTERPELLAQESLIRSLLSGQDLDTQLARATVAELERLSGLELGYLRVLYRSPGAAETAADGHGVIAQILEGDPHKAVINTRRREDGPVVRELISGR